MAVGKGLCLSQTIPSMRAVRCLLDFGSLPWTILDRSNGPRFLPPHSLCGVKLQQSPHSALSADDLTGLNRLSVQFPRATAGGNLILYLGSVWSRAEQALCVQLL